MPGGPDHPAGPREASAGFTPLDAIAPRRWPALGEFAAGRIRLLGVSRDLGEPAGWGHADAPGDSVVSVSASARLRLGVEPGMVATRFQSTTVAPVLICRIDSGLAVRISTCWRRTSRASARIGRAM